MNILRLLAAITLSIALCSGLSSCSKDEDTEKKVNPNIETFSKLIIGKWVWEESTSTSKTYRSLEFFSNGSCKRRYKWAVNNYDRWDILDDTNEVLNWKLYDVDGSLVGLGGNFGAVIDVTQSTLSFYTGMNYYRSNANPSF
ncbi:hypothetical protein [Bacteroides sp.]|uniref:hypothetical protein n=1 Tax=Bacteroides sp. TaxID=29523 RepID=UPI002FCB94A5